MTGQCNGAVELVEKVLRGLHAPPSRKWRERWVQQNLPRTLITMPDLARELIADPK